MREFKRTDARNVHIIIALILLILAFFIQIMFPPKAAVSYSGAPVPIIALEFAQTEQEILDLYNFSDSDEKLEFIAAMHLGNYFDFAYMVFYSLFLASAVWWMQLKTGIRGLWLMQLLVITALLGDIIENIYLLKINDAIRLHREFNAYISPLVIITRIKWFALAVVFTLSYFFMESPRKWLTKIRFMFLLALPVGIVAQFYKPYMLTVFVYLIMISFLLIFLNILLSKNNQPNKPTLP